jgi:ribokinase
VPDPTGTALIVVDADGENSIVVCPGANYDLNPTLVRIDPHGAVLCQLELLPGTIETVLALTDGFVAINASPITQLTPDLRRRAQLLIVNETEFAGLTDLATVPLTARTLGERGAILYQYGEPIAEAAVAAAEVTNTVGAGDAFAAALTLGLLRGDPPDQALHRACAVGAAAVGDPRSQPALEPLDRYPGH